MAIIEYDQGEGKFSLKELSPLQVKILSAGANNIFNGMKGRKMESNEDYENMQACEELTRLLTINTRNYDRVPGTE